MNQPTFDVDAETIRKRLEVTMEPVSADPLNTGYDAEHRAAPGAEPPRTPPRSLSILAYGACALSGALVMGLAWMVFG